MSHLRQFWNDTQAVTSIEYALLASLIAIVILVAVDSVGKNVSSMYTTIATQIANAL
jgi:pilus assembly protein Flp/PilA